jgi:O-antigen/teichoic acid export membrane protein
MPLYLGGLYGLQRQALANALSVVVGIFQDGGALLAILAVPTIGAFMSWHLASGVVAVIVAAAVLRHAIPKVPGVRRFSREAWVNSYRFGAGWFGHSAGSAIVTQADKVLVTRFIPLGAFGYYSIAQSLATFLMTLISPVQVAAFPRLAQLVGAGDRAGVEQEYERASEYMALLLFPSAAVLIAFAPSVLLAWTRKSDVAANSSALLQIFVAGACCAGVAAMLTTVQGAYGWLRAMVTTSLTAAALAFPLTYLGVTTLGVRGAAMAWTLLSSALLITAPFAHRKLGLGPVWRWFGASVILPAAAAAAVAFLGRLLVPALEPRSFLFLVSIGLVWLCCCAAAALVLPHVRASVRELHLRLRPA